MAGPKHTPHPSPDQRIHIVPLWEKLPEVHMIGGGELTAAQTLPNHRHPGRIEICYIARGRFLWRVGRESHQLTGGDLYFTFPDEPHGGLDDVFHPGKLYWLILELPPRCPPGYLRLPPEEGRALHRALADIGLRKCKTQRPVGDRFDRLLASAIHGGDDPNPRQMLGIRVALIALLEEILQAACEQQDPGPEPGSRISACLSLMEQNLANPLPLEALARKTGWSLSHFKFRFREELGIGPGQYYLQLRVDEALARLAGESVTLSALAQELGFSSGQYLSTCIKRITGKSPSAHRGR